MIYKFCLLSLVFLTLSSFGQKTIPKDTIIGKLRKVRSEVLAINPLSREIKNQVNKCRDEINDAITNVAQYGDNFPALYLENLSDIIIKCEGMNQMDTIIQNRLLVQLSRDIKLKFGSNSKRLENTISTDLITVKVITKKNGVPLNGLSVNCAALGYKVDYDHPNYTFKRLSSPVEDQMVAGVYEFWITEAGSKKVLQSRNIEIDPEEKDNSIEFDIH